MNISILKDQLAEALQNIEDGKEDDAYELIEQIIADLENDMY